MYSNKHVSLTYILRKFFFCFLFRVYIFKIFDDIHFLDHFKGGKNVQHKGI